MAEHKIKTIQRGNLWDHMRAESIERLFTKLINPTRKLTDAEKALAESMMQNA